MAYPELVEFISTHVTDGKTEEDIRNVLQEHGWQPQDIDEAFAVVERHNQEVVKREAQPKTEPERDHSEHAIAPNSLDATMEAFGLNEEKPKMIAGLGAKAKVFVVGGTVLTLIGLVLGGLILFISYYRSPERLLHNVWSTLLYSRTLDITVETNQKSAGDIEGSIFLSGALDRQDDTTLMKIDVEQNVTIGSINQRVSVFVRSNSGDDIVYSKIIAPPTLESLASINNQWIVFDNRDSQYTNIVEDGNPIFDVTALTSSIDNAEWARLQEVLIESQFIQLGNSLGKEDLNGKLFNHYPFTINTEELQNAISSVINTLGVNHPVVTMLAALENAEGSLWVNTSNFQIGKIEIEHLSAMISGSEEPVITTLTFSDYNEGVEIDFPSEAVTLDGVQVNTVQEDAEDSDDDGLSDEEEREFGTDPNNADTDADGFLDGDEVKNGFNPLGDGRFVSDQALVDDAKRLADISAMQTAIELYFEDNEAYPPIATTWAELGEELAPYLSSIPTNSEVAYTYLVSSSQLQYVLATPIQDRANLVLQNDADGGIDGANFFQINSDDVFLTRESFQCDDPVYCVIGRTEQ